jgi:hypothetical protein
VNVVAFLFLDHVTRHWFLIFQISPPFHAFQSEYTQVKNLSVPCIEVNPLGPLFERVKEWKKVRTFSSPVEERYQLYNQAERCTMTGLERTIIRELATLPETRRADVLAFVRFLKLSIPGEQKEREERFDRALKSIRARARKLNITPEDIDAEIRAVREGR